MAAIARIRIRPLFRGGAAGAGLGWMAEIAASATIGMLVLERAREVSRSRLMRLRSPRNSAAVW
jgi:hypothetical protein